MKLLAFLRHRFWRAHYLACAARDQRKAGRR